MIYKYYSFQNYIKAILLLIITLVCLQSCDQQPEEKVQERLAKKQIRRENKQHKVESLARGSELYRVDCASCHTLTEEVLVGPGLGSIYKRQTKQQIAAWIQNPPDLIYNKKDPYAVDLLIKYNYVIMPPYMYSDKDLESLLVYLEQHQQK